MNRTAVQHQNAALVCNAYGDHPISIVWKLKQKQIFSNTKRLYSRQHCLILEHLIIYRYSIAEANSSDGVMNTLTILDVTREDGQAYTCLASNKFGSEALPVYLFVFGNYTL